MFNVVKRRDFMLAADVATKEEAEKIAGDYGREYVAIRVEEPRMDKKELKPRSYDDIQMGELPHPSGYPFKVRRGGI